MLRFIFRVQSRAWALIRDQYFSVSVHRKRYKPLQMDLLGEGRPEVTALLRLEISHFEDDL